MAVQLRYVAASVAAGVVSALAAVPAAASVPGGSWPQYRHDTGRTGANPGESMITPATVSRLAPSRSAGVRGGGCDISEAAVVSGRLSLQTSKEHVLTDDASSLTREWTAGIQRHGGGSFHCTTPASDGSTVYAAAEQNDAVTAFDAATGAVRWTWSTVFGGVRSSPLLADGLVVVLREDGTLVALDATTGTVRWTVTEPADVDRTASPVAGAGRVYLAQADGLAGYDPATGKQVFHAALPGNVYDAVVTGGRVYLTTDEDNTSVLVASLDARTGRRIWSRRVTGPYFGVLTLANGLVFLPSLGMRALDAATGATRWGTSAVNPGNDPAAEAGGVLYVPDFEVVDGTGQVTVAALDAATGRLLWRSPVLPDFVTGVEVVAGTVYVETASALLTFRLR